VLDTTCGGHKLLRGVARPPTPSRCFTPPPPAFASRLRLYSAEKEGQWGTLGGRQRSTSRSSDGDGDDDSGCDRMSTCTQRRSLVWFGAASASTQALWAMQGKRVRPLSQVAIKLVPSDSRELAALDAMAGVRCCCQCGAVCPDFPCQACPIALPRARP
jgi:hypothetical protein